MKILCGYSLNLRATCRSLDAHSSDRTMGYTRLMNKTTVIRAG